jgi:mRNA interferase MazF
VAGLIRRGEIRSYRFAKPDKRRPVLVLTRNSVIDVLGDVTVAPITTTIRNIPTEVLVGAAEGLPRDCAVNLDHLQTVPEARLGSVVGTLGAGRMAEVRTALLFALGFSGTP